MDMSSHRVAIVAALESEVRPMVKSWARRRREFDGRAVEFFETDRMVLVCGGIGAECARRATEAVVQLYDPSLVISAGFAGALRADLRVGQVLTPRVVIDARDGSRVDTGGGSGIVVTFNSVADAAQKAKLAEAFGAQAQAVDMEAAAVARGAEAHGVRFMAYKAISDASDFSLPALGRFVGSDGKFQTGKFAAHVLLRPWLWKSALRLAKDSALAAKNLCASLADLGNMGTKEEETEPVAVPATVSAKS
jgi:adenosylhomocysteine nucleosidase